MPPCRYRLIDVDGRDLGPFVTSRADWLPGGTIELAKGYLRVTAIVKPETDKGFRAYLVVEPFEPNH